MPSVATQSSSQLHSHFHSASSTYTTLTGYHSTTGVKTATMDSNLQAMVASFKIRRSVIEALRKEYPWMKNAAVAQIGDKCHGNIVEGIKAQ